MPRVPTFHAMGGDIAAYRKRGRLGQVRRVWAPVKRVPASLVLLVLHAEADRSGDERYRIAGATLRQWVRRGHITRGPGGYDLVEILAYLERRNTPSPTR